MKYFYRYIFSTMILCCSGVLGGSPTNFTSAQLARLAQERTTNLVIINDVQEYVQGAEITVFRLVHRNAELKIGAMHTECMRAMSSDQLVLLPKLLFISMQNIVATFNAFVSTDFEFPIYSAQCRKLKNIYDQINAINSSSESSIKFLFSNKKAKLELLRGQLQEVLNDSTIDATIRFNIQEMFSTYMYHESMVRQGYVCKQVTKQATNSDQQENDFLLFVPKALQNVNEDSAMQDALLGLSWANLPDYDYTKTVNDNDADKIIDSAQNALTMKTQGEQLLKALDVLQFTDASVPRESLPFLNLYITGHGSKDIVTAEISIKQKDDGSPSDFAQVLNSFDNNFRTQSLAIASCYSGGKKLVDTYNIDNFYNNAGLEDISYPLIMVGSTFQPTTTNMISSGLNYERTAHFSPSGLYLPPTRDPVSRYFADLDPSSPDYQGAVRVLSEGVKGLQSGATDIRNPQNYANVKMPHVSWFSAVQSATLVKQLSQIAMSAADKPIVIPSNVKLLLLSANYIPQPLQFDDTAGLPKLLPVNALNQNYYFESVVIDKGVDELSSILAQLFVSDIEEPINIVFKNITLLLEKFSNVTIFMHQDINGDGIFQSGYMFANEDGEARIASWPSNQKMPDVVVDTSYDAGMLQQRVDTIAGKVQESLPPALKSEFVAELSSKLNIKKSEGLTTDPIVEAKSGWVKDPVTEKWTSDLFPAKPAEKPVVEPVGPDTVRGVGLKPTKTIVSTETLAQQQEDARLAEHNSKSFIDGVKNITLFRNSQNIINDKKVSFTEWLRGQADRRAVENRIKVLPSDEGTGEGGGI